MAQGGSVFRVGGSQQFYSSILTLYLVLRSEYKMFPAAHRLGHLASSQWYFVSWGIFRRCRPLMRKVSYSEMFTQIYSPPLPAPNSLSLSLLFVPPRCELLHGCAFPMMHLFKPWKRSPFSLKLLFVNHLVADITGSDYFCGLEVSTTALGRSVWLRAVVWVQGPHLATSFLLTDMQAVQGTPCKREGTV